MIDSSSLRPDQTSLLHKIFRVERTPYHFAIRVLGRAVFLRKHSIIMSFTTADHFPTKTLIPVHIDRITEDNLDSLHAIDRKIRKKYPFLAQKKGTCEGFGLWTDNGKPAAYSWIMFRGGRVDKFRFRNIDAWIFAVFVAENYRRKGLCEYMLNSLLHYLHSEKGINRAYLEVRKDNYPARAAYTKLRGKEEFRVKSYRFCKITFPLKPVIL